MTQPQIVQPDPPSTGDSARQLGKAVLDLTTPLPKGYQTKVCSALMLAAGVYAFMHGGVSGAVDPSAHAPDVVDLLGGVSVLLGGAAAGIGRKVDQATAVLVDVRKLLAKDGGAQ